jgi:peptidoglycan/xylan/chitin deacetylase (PgdA/CDA1 family)
VKLTIVMYHYVRPLQGSRFPDLKALELADFVEQLAYIRRHYSVISGTDLLDAAVAEAWDDLPPSPALLTFDDGYADHFTHVFPLLERHGVSGSFFVSGRSVLERRMLNVNKIHFILAAVRDKRALVDRLLAMIAQSGPQFGCRSGEEYWKALAVPSRFDPAEVVLVKRLLQRELPTPLRTRIVDDLFHELVTTDESGFAAELYLTVDHIADMRDAGMYFGSHGYEHSWLSHLDRADQEVEIRHAREFLQLIGMPPDAWIMCYPHGAYNASLLDLLRTVQCRIGLTTSVGIANLGVDDPLILPRLNTNDLPKRMRQTDAYDGATAAASGLPHAADM